MLHSCQWPSFVLQGSIGARGALNVVSRRAEGGGGGGGSERHARHLKWKLNGTCCPCAAAHLQLCFPARHMSLCWLAYPSHALKRSLAAEVLACGVGPLQLEQEEKDKEEEKDDEEEALCVTWADDGSLSMQVKP